MLFAATATWSLSACTASAQSQAPQRQARVFVIAHGGKAQADEFKKAAEWLRSAGHHMELHETKSPEDLSKGVKEYITEKGGKHNNLGQPAGSSAAACPSSMAGQGRWAEMLNSGQLLAAEFVWHASLHQGIGGGREVVSCQPHKCRRRLESVPVGPAWYCWCSRKLGGALKLP